MTRADYEEVLRRVREAGYTIASASYGERTWRGWTIDLWTGDEHFLLGWDNRDNWLHIERDPEEPPPKTLFWPVVTWKMVWLGKSPDEHNADEVLSRLPPAAKPTLRARQRRLKIEVLSRWRWWLFRLQTRDLRHRRP